MMHKLLVKRDALDFGLTVLELLRMSTIFLKMLGTGIVPFSLFKFWLSQQYQAVIESCLVFTLLCLQMGSARGFG